MKKQASARIKNKIKTLVVRSISNMERSLSKGRDTDHFRSNKKHKKLV